MRGVEETNKLLGLNWYQVEAIKARAAQRGLAKWKVVAIFHIGMEEKQFRSGHQYISSMVDLQGNRMLGVIEERTLTSKMGTH